jgi:hypothetical protein
MKINKSILSLLLYYSFAAITGAGINYVMTMYSSFSHDPDVTFYSCLAVTSRVSSVIFLIIYLVTVLVRNGSEDNKFVKFMKGGLE